MARKLHYKLVKEQKMVALSKKEILNELKKLGIDSPSELKAFLEDYKAYYYLLSSDNHLARDQKQVYLRKLISFLKCKKNSVIP